MTTPTVHTLVITLIDDTVFNRSNATAGGHDTLTRIPGSALLGAAAARLYTSLGAERAFLAFHSGKLHFGDGWPLAEDGAVALPVPQCLHRPKEKPWLTPDGAGARVKRDSVRNFLLVAGFDDDSQPKQLRDGYLTLDGRWIEPIARHRIKTAIDPRLGRASDGQLFGYTALQAGQRFAAELHADADFPKDLLDAVLEALHGQVLLGRSRSAEYGAAHITRVAGAAVQRRSNPALHTAGDAPLVLWLVSDLAPADASGVMPGTVQAGALGLPDGCDIDWTRSFARARSYSMWNSHRHGYAAERWVLEAGSVLCVTLPPGTTAEQRAALCARLHATGIGLGREAGLGQVWADAPLLSQPLPQFDQAHRAANPALADTRPAAAKPAHGYGADLLDWLDGKTDATRVPYDDVRAFISDYRRVVESGRRAAGIPAGARDYAPSRSQWGSVYERLRQPGADFVALFDGINGVIKPSAKGWSLEVRETASGDGQRRNDKPASPMSLAAWIQRQWAAPPWNKDLTRLRHLARHLREVELHAPATQEEARHG